MEVLHGIILSLCLKKMNKNSLKYELGHLRRPWDFPNKGFLAPPPLQKCAKKKYWYFASMLTLV